MKSAPKQHFGSAAWRDVGKLGSFFLLLALLALGINTIIDFGLRRIKTAGFGVTNRIVNGEINADILISGSSRALTHYDPRIIQQKAGRKAYNIGLNGSQTDMQLARLRTYLRHNTKPALLIHNLDLFSFQVTHGGVYDPGQYLPYLKEAPIYEALIRINPEVWKAKYLPLYGYAVEDMRFTWFLGLRGCLGYNPPEDHFLGFQPRNLAWTGEFEHFETQHREGVRFEMEPAGVSEMESLLALCSSNNIKVILVYSPEYLEMQKLTTNRKEIFSRFDELAARFAVEIWDFSTSPICGRREFFYNSQHLNAAGADAFSNELAARLELYLQAGALD